jgi:hypothetical protein
LGWVIDGDVKSLLRTLIGTKRQDVKGAWGRFGVHFAFESGTVRFRLGLSCGTEGTCRTVHVNIEDLLGETTTSDTVHY